MSKRYFGDKMKKLSLIFILISFLSAKSYFVEFVNQSSKEDFEKKYHLKAIKKYDTLYLYELKENQHSNLKNDSSIKKLIENRYKPIELR